MSDDIEKFPQASTPEMQSGQELSPVERDLELTEIMMIAHAAVKPTSRFRWRGTTQKQLDQISLDLRVTVRRAQDEREIRELE